MMHKIANIYSFSMEIDKNCQIKSLWWNPYSAVTHFDTQHSFLINNVR